MDKKYDFLATSIALSISLAIIWAIYYVMLPPLNIGSVECWLYVFFACIISATILKIISDSEYISSAANVCYVGGAIIFILLLILAGFTSSRFFHARAYSSILQVEDGEVSQIPNSDGTGSIALMDTASARILGNREVGSLSEVVSQYELDEDYTQINYKNKPYKVSPLTYAGFFKWNNNRSNGIPGYVLVDPVTFEGKYVKLDKGMKYVPSAYFGEDLDRKIHSEYPGLMYRNLHFEIDEDGNPWYIAATVKHTIGLFGGTKVTGCIVINPFDGSIKMYDSNDEVDSWIDVVYDGDLICEQYNDYAQLQNGFWNSMFGQRGCRKVTESDSMSDFGYICKNNDVYIYTGVTSVTNDSSNLGFIIANERTGQTQYIECAGADEFSAMSASEGEVQEKRYSASFPSLIDVDGTPTYIMVLKDDNGIVKLYACVNVEQYSQVATASTQKDCVEKYRLLLSGNISQDEAVDTTPASEVKKNDELEEADLSKFKDKEITVKHLEKIDKDGNTYLYLVDSEDNIYYAKYIDVIDMILVSEGDKITIKTDGKEFRFSN